MGRYLLLLNANRRQKGLYILSPIGGALNLYDEALYTRLGAIPESSKERDLRMLLPVKRLGEFRAWFRDGEGRERSPFRELYEELVNESRLLPELRLEDVRCEYLWTQEDESLTQRQGQTGLLTHYFLEIYDVTFTTSVALGPLLVAPPDSGACWVTEDQIRGNTRLTLVVDGARRDVGVRGELLLPPE